MNSSNKNTSGTIPDLDIIDLDDTTQADVPGEPETDYTDIESETDEAYAEEGNIKASTEENSEEDAYEEDTIENTDEEDEDWEEDDVPRKFKFRINSHIVTIGIIALFVVIFLIRFSHFGQLIDPSELFKDDTPSEVKNLDTWDNLVPLTDDAGEIIPINKKDGYNIVLFGNAPFSDDRYSQDGIANMLAKETGATVYNFSLAGSYVVSEQNIPLADVQPLDAFNFYWMTLLTTGWRIQDNYSLSVAAMGDNAPEAVAEVRQGMNELDFNTVDVFVVMYDATDYLLGHNLNSEEDYEVAQRFNGNMEAGLDILNSQFPNARIIVMSPPYAFADEKDDNGNYISSDIKIYNQEPLSMYVISECMSCALKDVTFIDNFYGTFSEDNAKDYLIDNLHLNVEGRKKVVSRLIKAIEFYGFKE